MKKETRKMIRDGIFFAVILILTYTVIFSKIDFKGIRIALRNSKLIFILIAFLLATNNITCEAINLKRNFKLMGDKIKFASCLKYSIIGFFFSSITPASTGGQPMQLYAMTKDKIKLSHGASALFTSYIFYMISAVFMAIIGFIVNYEYINEIKFFKYLIYMGLLANIILTLAVLMAMFTRKLPKKGLNLIISIISKFNQEKAEKVSENWNHQLDEYHKSARFIVSHKMATFKTSIISFLQVVSIHSVPYFIFMALGYGNYPYIQMLLLQSTIFISVSAIPLPGTVGVSETGFVIMYRALFQISIVDTAMILSRASSFYLLVILTGISLLIFRLKKGK